MFFYFFKYKSPLSQRIQLLTGFFWQLMNVSLLEDKKKRKKDTLLIWLATMGVCWNNVWWWSDNVLTTEKKTMLKKNYMKWTNERVCKIHSTTSGENNPLWQQMQLKQMNWTWKPTMSRKRHIALRSDYCITRWDDHKYTLWMSQ